MDLFWFLTDGKNDGKNLGWVSTSCCDRAEEIAFSLDELEWTWIIATIDY